MLSDQLKQRIRNAITNQDDADELISAIEDGAGAQSADVAALGSTSNLPTSNVTLSTTDTYTDAAVKTAIDSATNTLRIAAEARLDAIEAKIDETLAALKTATIML